MGCIMASNMRSKGYPRLSHAFDNAVKVTFEERYPTQ
jgi:hypothetical protein